MATNYTGHFNVVCTTLDEFNRVLTDAQAARECFNIVSDSVALTISFDIDTTR